MYNTELGFGKYFDTRFLTEKELKEQENREKLKVIGRHFDAHAKGIYSTKAYQTAMLCGNDIFKIVQAIQDSLAELQFNFFVCPKPVLSVGFHIGNDTNYTITMSINADTNLVNATGEPLIFESSRFYIMGSTFDKVMSLFDFIESWKKCIRDEMADRLINKSEQQELFSNTPKSKRKRK